MRPLFPLFVVFLIFSSTLTRAEDLRSVYEQATDAYNAGDFSKAADLFTQAIEMAPKFAPAYVGLGMALKANGADIEEVLYNYKKATEVDPGNAAVLEQAGRLYYSLNKYDKAEEAYLKVLKINPAATSVKTSLAWLYLMARPNPEKAARYFKEVLKVSPAPNIYFGLGMAYFANNDREKTLDMITALRGMGQEDLAGKLEKAMRENRKVVLEAPDQEPVPHNEPSASEDEAPAAPVGIKVRLREKLSVLN